MGAIAEAFAAYAQPLIDQTDGSLEQLNKAFGLAQLCYNLALVPDDTRDSFIKDMRPKLNMDDKEFDEFMSSLVIPMIRRHQEMFPLMHARILAARWQASLSPQVPAEPAKPDPARILAARWHATLSPRVNPETERPAKRYAGTDRYAPCPCNSGQKYKFCCGAKGR